MELKLHPIQIDPGNPFDNDKLEREGEIQNLSELVTNINSPAVIAINSRWGTGKTTFIEMWKAYLAKEGVASLYFNAWATDFSPDPLVSFLGEMNAELNELTGKSEEAQETWDKTKKIGAQIAKRGLPALIRVATVGVIDADKIIEDEVSKVMQSLTGDVLDEYLAQKQAIVEFRESLAEFIALSTEDNPLIIFIDELDRCRPDYSIALLERIKHLFDIEGIVFVLALDKEQLGHAVCSVYGQGIDSVGYIRRFIDFEYLLKKPDVEPYIKSLTSVLNMNEFFEARKEQRAFQHEHPHLEKVFILLAKTHDLTLREIEQLLANINLALCATKINQHVYPALLAFLIVTKDKYRKIYEHYISEPGTEKEIIELLHRLVPDAERFESFECAHIEGFLIAAKNRRGTSNIKALIHHKENVKNEEIDYKKRDYSRRVIEISEQPLDSLQDVSLSHLIDKIDLVSRLSFTEIKS